MSESDAKSVQHVLWSAYNDQRDRERPIEDPLAPLRVDLHDRYHRVRDVADHDDVWQRATTVNSLHD